MEISALHTAADNAVVDADDIISDVLDDKDLVSVCVARCVVVRACTFLRVGN